MKDTETRFVEWLRTDATDPLPLARFVTWSTAQGLFEAAQKDVRLHAMAARCCQLFDAFPTLDPPTVNGRTWIGFDRIVFIRVMVMLAEANLLAESRAGVQTRLEEIRRRFPDLAVQANWRPPANVIPMPRQVQTQLELPVRDEFDDWIAKNTMTPTQGMFVRTVRQLSKSSPVTMSRLNAPPFTQIGDPKLLFTNHALGELITMANKGRIVALLDANPATTLKPVILKSPVYTTASLGGQVHFYVNADGKLPLKYQWWFKKDSKSVEVALENQNQSIIWVSDISDNDSGDYWCEVSNAHGSAKSSNAYLYVRHPVSQGERLQRTSARTEGHTPPHMHPDYSGYSELGREALEHDWRPGGTGYSYQGTGYSGGYFRTTTKPSTTCVEDDMLVNAVPAPPLIKPTPAPPVVARDDLAWYGEL